MSQSNLSDLLDTHLIRPTEVKDTTTRSRSSPLPAQPSQTRTVPRDRLVMKPDREQTGV